MRTLAAVGAALATLTLPAALPAQQRDCQETRNPKRLPSVSALVDSASLMTELAAIDAPDGMLFSLAFLEGDSLPLVRPLYETASTAAEILVRWIRPQKPSKLWGIRVRVAQGAAPSLRLERAMYCPPVPIPNSRPQTTTIIVQPEPTDRPPNPNGRRTIGFEARISEEGLPISVIITKSSGLRDLDDQIAQGWQQTRFRPALLDGLPVEARFKTGGQSPRM